MTRQTRLVVHGTGSLLIAALIAAPVWDFWRYRGLRSSVDPRTPLAIVLPPSSRTPVLATFSGGDLEPSSATGWSGRAHAQWPARFASGNPPSITGAASLGARAHATAADTAPEGSTRDGSGVTPVPTPPDPRSAPTTVQGAAVRKAPGAGRPGHGHVPGDPGPADPAHAPAANGSGDATSAPPVTAVLVGVSPVPTNARDLGPTPPSPVPPPPTRAPAIPSIPGDPAIPVAFDPEVSLITSSVSLVVGDTLTVTVKVHTGDPVTSLPLHLMFDPAVLEFSDGATDPSLGSRLQPVLLASVSPNRPGDLAVGLSFIESGGAFMGTGVVVVLHFRAIGSGDSDLEFSRASLRGATSEPLPAVFQNSRVSVH